MNFLGIDIGTSSICGVAYDTSSKHVISITKANNANITSFNVWEQKQDAEIIVRIVLNLIQEIKSKCPIIQGIGLSGQMHGIVYINSKGEAVSPLYTWQDARGDLSYKKGLSYAAYLSQKVGLSLSSGFGLVTHFYNKENKLVPPEAVKICTIMDYVAMRLTKRKKPLTEYSNAASLGFFDCERLTFDEQVLDNLEIDTSILPDVDKSSSLVGYFEETPVYVAIGDNQASFIGSVRSIEHSIHVTVGTSAQISAYSQTYEKISSLDTRPLPGGGYILVGAALCGGYSFSLLNKFFSETIKLCTGIEMTDSDLYKIMVSIPYKKEQKNDLQVDTLFDGTRLHPNSRGKIINISRSNWTPENLILGFLRGISQELFDFYELLPSSIKKGKDLLIGSGNGIRKNPLLCQIIEDRFGHSLQVSKCKEEAALGACICGMVGAEYLKHFSDFDYEVD